MLKSEPEISVLWPDFFLSFRTVALKWAMLIGPFRPVFGDWDLEFWPDPVLPIIIGFYFVVRYKYISDGYG